MTKPPLPSAPITVGLVACSKSKTAYATEAQSLYTSPLFRFASAYAKTTYNRWYILSAKHGLIAPETTLEPYDLSLKHLSDAERRAWAERVLQQIANLSLSDARYFLHAGARYRQHLADPLRAEVPLRNLGIGKQLSWYHGWRTAFKPGASSD